MTQVTIRGVDYLTGRVDTFAQLHLARKLGPSLPIIEGLIDPRNAEKDKNILTVLMLSHISDTDTDFVIQKCMGVVMRRQGDGKAAKVQAPDGTLMFDDITLSDMLELTVAVIEENLGDFFRTALASMEAAQQEPKS